MRIQHIGNLFLLEHNVVNNNDISSYVAQQAAQCTNETKPWFTGKITKWLTNHDTYNEVIDPTSIPNPPAWLGAAIERGDEVRKFNPPARLDGKLSHLVDYLNHLTRDRPEVVKDQRRLAAMTVEAAFMKADRWVEGSAKKAAKMDVGEGLEIAMTYPNGFMMVDASASPEAIDRDGKILQNCLGQGYYREEIAQGALSIFFLYDKKKQPHVAISIMSGGRVKECKGKNNEPPVDKYAGMAIAFLNKEGFSATGNNDIRAMGYVENGEGKLVSLADSAEFVREDNGFKLVKIPTLREYWLSENDEIVLKLSTQGGTRTIQTPGGSVAENVEMIRFLCETANRLLLSGPSVPTSRHEGDPFLPYDGGLNKFGLPEDLSKKIGSVDGYDLYERNKTNYLVRKDFNTILSYVFNDHYKSWAMNIPRDAALDRANAYIHSGKVGGKLASALPKEVTVLGLGNNDWEEIFYRQPDGEFGLLNEAGDVVWKKGALSVRHLTYPGMEIYALFSGKDHLVEKLWRAASDESWNETEYSGVAEYDFSDFVRKFPDLISWAGSSEKRMLAWDLGINAKGEIVSGADARQIWFEEAGYTAYATVVSMNRRSGTWGCAIFSGTTEIVKLKCESSSGDTHPSTIEVINEVVMPPQKPLSPDVLTYIDANFTFSDKPIPLVLGLTSKHGEERKPVVHCNEFIEDGEIKVWRNYRSLFFTRKDLVIGAATLVGKTITKISAPLRDDLPTFHTILPKLTTEMGITYTDVFNDSEHTYWTASEEAMFTAGVMLDGKEGQYHAVLDGVPFIEISEKFETKKIVRIGGMTWWLKPYDPNYTTAETTPRDRAYSLVDKNGDTLLRLLFDENGYMGSTDKAISMLEGKIRIAVLALLSKEKLKATLMQSLRLKAYRTPSGNYIPGEDTPMAQFLNGRITFEDGMTFKLRAAVDYDGEADDHGQRPTVLNWELEGESDEGYVEMVCRVKIDDEGLDSVKYRKSSKTNPAAVHKHVQTLMKMLHKVIGE